MTGENNSAVLEAIYSRKESQRKVADDIANRITASGTSEGVKKAWEKRHLLTPQQVLEKVTLHDTAAFATKEPNTYNAHVASKLAYSLGEKASDGSGRATHNEAAIAHSKAGFLQGKIGNREQEAEHHLHFQFHSAASTAYFKHLESEKKSGAGKSTTGWRAANRERSINNRSDD